MDTDKKKELRAAYKERPREAGVVFVTCGATGEMFLADVVDSPAAFNRMRFQLSSGLYPDKRLQALWDQRGEDAFEFGVRAPGSHQAESRPRRPAPVGCFGFWDGLRKHKLTAF